MFNIVMGQDTCEVTLYDAKQNETLQFDFSLNDLDVHSRSQGYVQSLCCKVA